MRKLHITTAICCGVAALGFTISIILDIIKGEAFYSWFPWAMLVAYEIRDMIFAISELKRFKHDSGGDMNAL